MTYEEIKKDYKKQLLAEAMAGEVDCINPFEVRDIIAQQQESINRLKAENSNLSSDLTSLKKDLTSAKAEIERLQGEVKEKTETIVFLKDQAVGWSIDFCNLKNKVKTAKAEAIKEFAERLKKHAIQKFDWNEYVEIEDIDNLVKEMIAEKCVNQAENHTEKCVTADYCIVCGKHIPEGRRICPMCESGGEAK